MYKQLDKIGKFFYLGSIIPLFLSLITPLLLRSEFLFPFITTKTVFFRILIEIALFFYLLLMIKYPEFRPRMTKLMWAVTAFFVATTLASVFGVDVYKSFWGNIERGEGLLTTYHVFVFFFLSVQLLRTKELWLWFIRGTILVSLGTAIYALMQKLGSEHVIHSGENRLSATVGNAAFYAGYLLFGIFLSAWQFIKDQRTLPRTIYGIIIAFEAYILIETETRGSFLGLLVALIVIALMYVSLGKEKKRKIIAASAIGVLLLSGLLVWTQRDSQFVRSVPILQRTTTISFDDITTQSRLLTWDSSWQGFKDRPILGYGWENYNVAFNKYFHAEIFRDAGSQIWFDRAHNVVFDVLVMSGSIGFIAYVSIFIFALRALYLLYKREKDLPTVTLLTGLLVAYGVQNLFVFDVLATYIQIYLLLGFIAFVEYRVTRVDETEEAKQVASNHKSIAQLFPAIIAVLFVGLVSSIYAFNIRPAKANMTAVDALIAVATNQKAEAAEIFKEAIDLNTNQTPEIRQKYAEMAIELVRSNHPNQAFVSTQFTNAIVEMKNNIEEHPLDVQHRLFLMILYNQSDQFDNRRIDRLFEEAEIALELSPTRPQIYFEIGQAHMSRQEYDKGIEAFETALELQPKAIESHWNLAAAYAIAGKNDLAQKEFEFLEGRGFEYYTLPNLRRLIPVYVTAKSWEQLADVYEHLTQLEPTVADWYARLAATYQQLGRSADARTAANKAAELDPSIQDQVDRFLSELDDSTNPDPENEEDVIGEATLEQ